jgi:hypothetical protein
MSDKTNFLKDCVVSAASDDYEDFAMIMKDTESIASSRGLTIDAQEVADAVKRAIEEGLLEAFVLSATAPHSIKVEYRADRLRELWYYVTPKGKQAAKGMDSLSS